MKSLIALSLIALIALSRLGFVAGAETRSAASQGGGPVSSDQSATISIVHLEKEVAKLKQDMQQLKVEHQQLRVASLERELQQAAANRLLVQTEGALLGQDLQELDEYLSKPLDPESYTKLVTLKLDMTGGRAVVLDEEQQKAIQRETEIVKSLEIERQKLQSLSQ